MPIPRKGNRFVEEDEALGIIRSEICQLNQCIAVLYTACKTVQQIYSFTAFTLPDRLCVFVVFFNCLGGQDQSSGYVHEDGTDLDMEHLGN